MKHKKSETDTLILKSGEGRIYNCGTMTAVFKADENKTSEKYSISQWWLEPNSSGPSAHQHEDNEEVFYGLEGVTSLLVGENWIDVEKGTFLKIPAKTIHDFENRSDNKSGVLKILFLEGSKNTCLQ